MGWEEREKHLLRHSYHDLQSLCKQYNLPANKRHSQLARSLAMLLEKENSNSGPLKENLFGSTQASPATSSALLSNVKEASRSGEKDNHKRGPCSDRDNEDKMRLHVKHKKGPETQIDQTLKSDHGTRMTAPVSVTTAKADGFSHSCSEGVTDNGKPQSVGGIETHPELAIRNHHSAAHVNDKISFVASYPGSVGMVPEPRSHMGVGGNVKNKGSGSTNKISGNKTSTFQFFVMSDNGIDLSVDLNSTPGAWVDSFQGSMCISPSTHHSETRIFSNSISSLVSDNDQNITSLPGNIIMDIEKKEANNIAPCASSLGSTDGKNYCSEPCPTNAILAGVNSRLSASALPGILLEISGSQEGVPVVNYSCLTSDVQNNISLHMAGALHKNVLPQDFVDISERSHSLSEDSMQPTSKKNTFSPDQNGSIKIGCTQNILDACTDKDTSFASRNVVRSYSVANSSPPSMEKDEMVVVTLGAQLAHNSDTNEVLENEQVETVPMEEDNGHDDRLSVCQLARKTLVEQCSKDAQSDASSTDRSVAGNFNLTEPTPSYAALDNAITPLTSKHGEKTAESDDPVDKIRLTKPTRNILHSLRSAAAREQDKSSTSPRRSARLVPK